MPTQPDVPDADTRAPARRSAETPSRGNIGLRRHSERSDKQKDTIGKENLGMKDERQSRRGQAEPSFTDLEPDDDPWERKTILSLDGGGLKGLKELYILRRLMQIIGECERNHLPDEQTCSASYPKKEQDEHLLSKLPQVQSHFKDGTYLPCHYFDYFGGTDTGGLIAIMLGRMRYDADKAIRKMEMLWNVTNPKRPFRIRSSRAQKSNTDLLIRMLQDMTADSTVREREKPPDLLQSDAEMSRTLVLTVEKNSLKSEYRPRWLRSYPVSKRSNDGLQNLKIWEACRATSAAPEYFPKFHLANHKFYSGTMWSSNPAMELYREVLAMHERDTENPVAILLSLGIESQDAESVDWALREREQDDKTFRYFRISTDHNTPHMNQNDSEQRDNCPPEFRALEKEVRRYCEKPKVNEMLQNCAEMLVQRRIARASTWLWERRALGIYFDCKLCRSEERHGLRWVFKHTRSYRFESDVVRHHSPDPGLTDSPAFIDTHDFANKNYYSSSSSTTIATQSPDLSRTVTRDDENDDDNGAIPANIPAAPDSPSHSQVLSDTGLHPLRVVPTAPSIGTPQILDPDALPSHPRRRSRRKPQHSYYDTREDFIDHLQLVHDSPPPDASADARDDVEALLRESAMSTLL